MGRTVPSFRNVISEEKQEWKPFRNAWDKSQRKHFDEMWDIPRLYVMLAPILFSLYQPFQPIAISILFHHYKELLECPKQVEQLMMNNNYDEISSSSSNSRLTDKVKDFQNEMKQDHQIQQRELTLFDF